MTEPSIKSLKRREKLNRIIPLIDEGLNASEIGHAIGMSRRGVCSLLARSGFAMGRRGATQRVGAFIPRRVFGVVDEIAKEAGVSRSTMVKRIIEAACPTPADARRFLGKLARRAK